MSKLKVAINGFGRIGRVTFRILSAREDIDIVAVNDLTDNATLATLLKYDSVHGRFDGTVTSTDDSLIVNGEKIKALSERNPENLPWGKLGVDVVIESTGVFRTKETAGLHIKAGAKKVIISAPAKGDDVKTVVLGINDELLEASDTVVSNASCTTNCVAPLVKLLDENFEVVEGFLTTIHAYTSDQNIHDAPHSDLRRARAAAVNIVPTSTGAAKAVTKIFPHLKGKLDGSALRVPIPNGSLTELIVRVKGNPTVEGINKIFKAAADGPMKGILAYSVDPIVSQDIVTTTYSSIFDAPLTSVLGNTVKVVSWYDNEYGYSARLVDLVVKMTSF